MWISFIGTVVLQIRSADIRAVLERLTNWNITLLNICQIDDLTIHITVSKPDSHRVPIALKKLACEISVVHRKGIYWKFKEFLRRPVFTIGVFIYLIFVLAVPGKVFFVQVEGNSAIPARMILEAAESCGIHFGADRREVRSERVKNALLEKIPTLQWAGVNTKGCVAVISVRERQETKLEAEKTLGSIIASRDAILQQITVLKGTQLCTVGQAVKAGELLVSGYKDYGISIKFTGSDAVIFGQTERKLEAITPALATVRTEKGSVERKYSLIIGKKQINFFKDSGISDTTCVKMYKKTYLVLPGGFTLPVALVTQEIVSYETEAVQVEDFSFVGSFSRDYMQSIMIDGTILQEKSKLSISEDVCRFIGNYSCYEQIGLTIEEELINRNE